MGISNVSEQQENGDFLIMRGKDPGVEICDAYLWHVEPAMEIIIDSLSRSIDELHVLDIKELEKIRCATERLQNVFYHSKTTLNVMRQIYRKYYDDVHG